MDNDAGGSGRERSEGLKGISNVGIEVTAGNTTRRSSSGSAWKIPWPVVAWKESRTEAEVEDDCMYERTPRAATAGAVDMSTTEDDTDEGRR